ncbi:MAG: cytochrome c oxidase accessory protein CcoG [Bdellovibrionales bacterium]|nr:cytochrome c oxidase accessory protein CcoG [Bdellovibrionales bacterium]
MVDYERLESLDEFGGRVPIIPLEVRGVWQKRRTQTQVILLLLFLLLPWVSINGSQAVLLNISRREFAIFGLRFFAHDAPLIFFILAILTVGLAFLTAVWGRVWCGWACPQTVFIDGIFRRIEKWIEGSALERIKLQKQEMSLRKLRLKTIKWFLFFIVSAFIAHSFIAYFVGSKELIAMMQRTPTENWSYFVLVMSVTGLLVFDFGWFREQFCIIMCPYGRVQSVLLDAESLSICYDSQRGEPRRGSPLRAGESVGDCVNCNRCVQVCPTKIDIRNGLQMECIACTACIDACDEIMEKVQKPKGLIRYDSVSKQRQNWWKRPRNLIYVGIILASFVALAWNIIDRPALSFSLLRGEPNSFSVTRNESGEELVTNHFRLHLKNQTARPQNYGMTVDDPSSSLTVAQNPITLKPFEDKTIHFFVSMKPEFVGSFYLSQIRLKSVSSPDDLYEIPIQIIGPDRKLNE